MLDHAAKKSASSTQSHLERVAVEYSEYFPSIEIAAAVKYVRYLPMIE